MAFCPKSSLAIELLFSLTNAKGAKKILNPPAWDRLNERQR